MEKKIGGTITLLLGLFGAVYSATTISGDKSKWIGGYTYTSPFTPHETMVIMVLCISLVMILIGAILLVSGFSDDANRDSATANSASVSLPSAGTDPYAQLDMLAQLHSKGVLSDEEYEELKRKQLAKIQ